ncbi:MAG: mechanosensitive ion channel family protein [Bacteroidia bacterium]|nr:mechanosensitive ion channel family protein [Bacteroidia bacterium]
MKISFIVSSVCVALFLTISLKAQVNETAIDLDSVNQSLLLDYKVKLYNLEQQRRSDSLNKAAFEMQISALRITDFAEKDKLLRKLMAIEENEKQRKLLKKQSIDSLKLTATAFPVLGVFNDTLFFIYAKIGASKPADRAKNISNRLETLFEDDALLIDSIKCVDAEFTYDIVYGETIISSVSETDALWQNVSKKDLAQKYTAIIQSDLKKAKANTALTSIIKQLFLLGLVLISTIFLFWWLKRGYKKLHNFIEIKKDTWLKSLAYNDYTFLSAAQEYKLILLVLKPLRWFISVSILYIALSLIFGIFPFTRNWAGYLMELISKPFALVFSAIWNYLPKLFTILVIYFVMKYVIRLVSYVFSEIGSEKLKIKGFYADWAQPTFSIVRFLLYAFMFILIFPYLPGSDSAVFKGVSVFIGIVFSLGSSSAIANMVAGLVITYMRPFKIGDRIKIGEVLGDVAEKNLLVTRVKTPKNEVITIPNSAVLSGNTINYSSENANNGLILHTTVTIGYDVPWKNMHAALEAAALRTNLILQAPAPFVLQTSLDDFYVSYQLNAYTKEVNSQASIYSELHQNIQDVCNERGIEIMSPHYRALRDGDQSTIPDQYPI